MAFSVAAVVRQSFRRLATGPALLILLAFAVVRTLAAVVPGQSIRAAPGVVGSGAGTSPVIFTGNLFPVVAGILSALFTGYLALVTIRVFAGQWGVVERAHLTHNVGWGLVNLYALFVILGIIVTLVGAGASVLGLLGLVILIIVVLVILFVAFLAPAFIAVEDANAVVAIRRSVRAAGGTWLNVAGVVAATVVVSIVLSAISGQVQAALTGPVTLIGTFIGTVLSGIAVLFLWIAVARTYDHIAESAY